MFAISSIYMNKMSFKFYNEGITKAALGLRLVLKDEELSFWSVVSLIETLGWNKVLDGSSLYLKLLTRATILIVQA